MSCYQTAWKLVYQMLFVVTVALLTTPAHAQWNHRFNQTTTQSGGSLLVGVEKAVDVLTDSSYIYVVGSTTGYNGSADVVVLRYSYSGGAPTVASFNRTYTVGQQTVSAEDIPKAAAIDANAIYVTGQTSSAAGGTDILTLRFAKTNFGSSSVSSQVSDLSNSGTESSNVFDGGTDIGMDIAVRGSYVYVTGHGFVGSGVSGYDIPLIRLNSSNLSYAPYPGKGNVLNFNFATSSAYDFGAAIAVDSSGNVYIGGRCLGPSGNGADYVTAKITSGNVASGWPKLYHREADPFTATFDKNQYIRDIILSSDETVIYVTGQTWGGHYDDITESGTEWDIDTLAYSTSTGAQNWVALVKGGPGINDVPVKMILDSSGSVFIAGTRSHPNGNSDYQTIKLSSSGSVLWDEQYDVSGNDQSTGLVISGSYVYQTGKMLYSLTNFDYVTIRRNLTTRAVDTAWTKIYAGSFADAAVALALGNGGLVVTGTSNGGTYNASTNPTGTNDDIVTTYVPSLP